MDKTDLEDFKKVLSDNSYTESDFEIKETDLTKWGSTPLVIIKGRVSISRVSTKKTFEYNSGYNTHWVVDFEKDLKQGSYD